jgi:hypothetical protein
MCAAAAIVAPLTAASAAVHSPPPGAALMQANENGWRAMSYRPGAVYMGQGGSPYVQYLAWANWGGSATTRSGQLVRQANPSCTPTYLCPVSKKPVTVYLHDIKTHSGQPYFAKMRWNFTSRNGYRKSIYWNFDYYPGGSVPFWH